MCRRILNPPKALDKLAQAARTGIFFGFFEGGLEAGGGERG